MVQGRGGALSDVQPYRALLYAWEEQDNLHEAPIRWLCDYHNLNEDELRKSLYWHQDNDAVSHLMRVASGLIRWCWGEPQILGQGKRRLRIRKRASESQRAGAYVPEVILRGEACANRN